MKKFLYIFIFLFGLISVRAQEYPVYMDIQGPDYIPAGSEFEVSVVARVLVPEPAEMRLYMETDKGVKPDRVLFRNKKGEKLLDIVRNGGEYNTGTYGINLPDSLYDIGNTFQVVLAFKAGDKKESFLGISGELITRDGEVLPFEPGKDYFDHAAETDFYFYEPEPVAGKMLSVRPGSGLSFKVEGTQDDVKRGVEFWVKQAKGNGNLLAITGYDRSDTIFAAGINEFEMFASPVTGTEIYTDYFLGKNTWFHIFVSLTNSDVTLYVNGTKVLSRELYRNFPVNEANWRIGNGSDSGKCKIDMLRLWNYEGSPAGIIENKHYTIYETDSTDLLLNLTFDNVETVENLKRNKDILFNLDHTRLEESDAPLFSRTPEINLQVHNTFYSIEWSNRDVSNAEYFVLERSGGENSFREIYRTAATEDPDKIYYYSDEIPAQKGVLFYRVKQVNRDGDEIFSPQVKIGQGKAEKYEIEQNYPNPFNPKTTITIEVLESTELDLKVYDVVGNKIETLHTGNLGEGRHTFSFDGSNLPSGIYFYEVKTPESSTVQKMILTK